MSVKPSISFRNITNYIVEPVGEPIITQPANYSIDFSPQQSCLEEAPDDGKQYGRENKTWTEIPEVPTKTSDLTNDSGFIDTETDPVYTSEKSTLALKNELTKESIIGIKTTDSPEFADTLITGLKSDANGGSIPAAIYTWFKGIFASLVDGSVKSYIIGILTVLKDLATRVGLLEDNSYLDRFKVPTKHLVSGEYFNTAKTAATALTSTTIVDNRLYMQPIGVSDSILLDNVRIRVTTGSGNIRLAIFNGTNFYPYTKVWESDNIDASSAGAKDIAISLTLDKNKTYWLALIADNTSVRLSSYQVYQMPPIKGNEAISATSYTGIYVNYTFGVLPTTLEGLTINDIFYNFSLISLRKA